MFGNKTLERLEQMLDAANTGSFQESDYDETKLSKLEAKWKNFLETSVLSKENLEKEKENIKSLVSDISHQTKTPMANIKLYAALLREKAESGFRSPDDAQQSLKMADELCRQTEKLDFLIQSLTKMSRLESNIVEVKPACQPVLELVREAVFNTRPKAEEKGIDVRLCCEEAGNAVYDKKWTREALENVLDNAVKYSPEGSSVDIFVTEYEMYTGISVRDEGMGIREEEIPKILPFKAGTAGRRRGDRAISGKRDIEKRKRLYKGAVKRRERSGIYTVYPKELKSFKAVRFKKLFGKKHAVQ